MKIALFILMICGKPDIYIWNDNGVPHAVLHETLKYSVYDRAQIVKLLFDKDVLKFKINDRRGMCT